MEKNCAENVHRKLVPDPFLILVKNPKKNHCMQKIIFKTRYFEKGLSKSPKKVRIIFSFEPSPF